MSGGASGGGNGVQDGPFVTRRCPFCETLFGVRNLRKIVCCGHEVARLLDTDKLCLCGCGEHPFVGKDWAITKGGKTHYSLSKLRRWEKEQRRLARESDPAYQVRTCCMHCDFAVEDNVERARRAFAAHECVPVALIEARAAA